MELVRDTNGSTRQQSSASTLPSLPSRTGDAAKYPAPPSRPSSPSQLAPSPPRPPDITLPAGTAGANSENHTRVPPHTETASHPVPDSGAARGSLVCQPAPVARSRPRRSAGGGLAGAAKQRRNETILTAS